MSSLAKYQSYLQFINESKIEVEVELKAPRQPYFAARKISNNTSKTPAVDASFVYQHEIENRRSMLERRRISPYAAKSPTSIVRREKEKLKLGKSERRKKLSLSCDRKAGEKRDERRDEKSEEQLQKALFDGVEFFRDLGKGAHAVVRSAIDWKNRRKIAVKVYRKDELSEEELEGIKLEILILRSVKHASIAALYDVIETPRTINLVMEYGGGNSLFQHIRSKPAGFFAEDEARPLFRQVLGAVAYLHERNVVHRDIKPENILINKAGQVKVIDFGFSLMSGPSERVDTYCGTVTYMAPEIVSKTPHVGVLADRWSLGVLLDTMLQGAFPFRASGEKELFAKIAQGEFDFVVDISPAAAKLIESFLVLKPSGRISPKDALESEWMKTKSKGQGK